MRFFRVLGAVWLVTVGVLAPALQAQGVSNMSYGITIGPTLPPTATAVKVGKESFFVYHGSFYRQLKVGYVLVPAPVGATIKALPRGATKFTIGKVVYFQHAGVTFKGKGKTFQVCAPPPGAPAAAPAALAANEDHFAVEFGDAAYVFRNGRFFLQSPDGLLGRSTPVGAIARGFPPDAMSVWFRDSEYFESSGVFFHEIAGGGFKVVLPPWQNTNVVTTDSLAQASPN
jgi:Family of unknown function (DUF6515)